jgi:hypothetical protein
MQPTPIQWLPVELIALIFFFIPDEQDQKVDTLVQTCRRWKEIVSFIWGPLKLSTWTSLDEVKSILNRGGDSLLGVTINPSSDAMDHPIGPCETEPYAALKLALSTSISRWRTLDIISLPDPQYSHIFFKEQSHTIHPMPMGHLRSLSIRTRHHSSHFLDLLLSSIGAPTSIRLTDMHLCSARATAYFTQPQCAHVFNYLTSFKSFLPQTNDVIDILPHFWRLEVLDVSGGRFPTYAEDIELSLTKTLRRMSLRGAPIGWMNHREFLRLESCTIVSPPASDTIQITSVPLCTKLHFEGPCLDTIQKFRISTTCTLTLRSTQWSKSRGNNQLSRLWGATLNQGVLRPTLLHLHLTCSSEQLLRALCSMPELKEMVLELDRPTALGRRFFLGFLPRSSQIPWLYKRGSEGDERLQACPSLGVLGLKYQRWFRPGELNEMPALVAMAHLDKRDPKLRVWVEKGAADQERVQLDSMPLSASVLTSLGLLQLIDGIEPLPELVNEVFEASFAILNPTPVSFCYPMTMVHISPSIHSCLFRRLQDFALYTEIDERVLFEALAHFEHLGELYVKRLNHSLPQPHLPLLRTLKKMRLGTTSLLWMEGCTLIKLEELKIDQIEPGSGDHLQCVQVPMCRSASFPQSISSQLLSAFKMPQLHSLDLLHQPVGPIGGPHYPSTQQFRLHTAKFCFFDSVMLQDALAMQPELEVLDVTLLFPCQLGKGLPELLDALMDPNKINNFDALDHATGPPRRQFPLCPNLKELRLELKLKWGRKLKLELEHEWKQVWEQEFELVQLRVQLRQWELELDQVREWKRQWVRVQVLDWGQIRIWERERERELVLKLKRERERELVLVQELVQGRALVQELAQELELKRKLVSREDWRTSEVRRCQKFMRRRMENGCSLRHCQLAWGSCRTEITNESIGLPYLDIPGAELPSLSDIFGSWELCSL